MKRGIVKKREFNGKLFLERKMLGIHDVLGLNRDCCIGCNICVKICPEKALEPSKAIVQNGKLFKKGIIDIDAGKCTLCGECVVLCPVNAINIFRNEEKMIPVIEAGVFPTLLKKITVNVKNCTLSCKLACKESCPTEAITVTIERAEAGEITGILNVSVDEKKCIFCRKCESECPQNAIQVTKPLQGLVQLNTDLCPENCQACVDICPSKALALSEDGTLRLEEQFCIYCGACQEVCPEKAIEVKITRVLYNQIRSGAWITALEKLIPPQYLVKELSAKSVKKLKEVVKKMD
jgi:4Fe-4S ferredoxin